MLSNDVVLVTDDASFTTVFQSAPGVESHNFLQLSADELLGELNRLSTSLVILDASMASADACELIPVIRRAMPECAVLMVADCADRDHAVRAISEGAADYLVRPVSSDVLGRKIRELVVAPEKEFLVAAAPATRHAVQLAKRAAVTDASILITGESGTGKEVFSRYIHQTSARKKQPFVAVNCAAIPEAMLESILFGHEKGAFTGATSRKSGKFEQADGGTLFLDEVAEMPLEQQAKLLRVLQEREVERLGGQEPVKINVRVLSATNRDLRKQVELGLFREDLYYRLNVFPLHLSPLRERREDILPLVKKMISELSHETGQPRIELSPVAAECLQHYSWPGNVRELGNVVQRACVLKRSWVILPSDLMLPDSNDFMSAESQPHVEEGKVVAVPEEYSTLGAAEQSQLNQAKLPGPARKREEWNQLFRVLSRNNGHRSRTAEELGMTTRMLRYKLAQLREAGLNVDDLIESKASA
ncbi:sigma-54-dependent Fis family transcriptional regulator [Endozoicomonas sp. OPT23]|uniref:sigma-54-dependent transcriptional regulator n=1 Tax=Endozoicomonas sp. OPT23 TaxID=2072845 RepID=UPI00129BEC95|nr:sigma-54 dependent transcriptional regulator [Endozoicomonas sp. OPT23]MRI33944.1 sigma-54-dependent Fis family transcriptional regulator [Endozoicomonas sp. OPT23]